MIYRRLTIAVALMLGTGQAFAMFGREFTFRDFDSIRTESEPCSGREVSGFFRIKVVQDSEYKVTMETNEDESDLYSVSQSGRVLILTAKPRKGNSLAGADVTVHMPDISSVSISGNNSFEATGDFDGDALSLSVSGVCSVCGLSGTWDKVDAHITGAASVSGLNLSAGDMDIVVSGASSVSSSSFRARKMDMELSGGAAISQPSIDADNLDVCCSGAALLSSGNVRTDDFGMDLSGGSKFDVDGSIGNAHVKSSGAAYLSLKGTGESLTYSGSGGSRLGARPMTFRDASVSVSGAAAASLTVTGVLSTSTSAVSRIDYYGSPKEVRSTDSNVHAHK